METCSPNKRRALAPLNSNALAAPKMLFKDGKPLGGPVGSPVKRSVEPRKRMFEVDGTASPVGKKACLGRDEVRWETWMRDGSFHPTTPRHARHAQPCELKVYRC